MFCTQPFYTHISFEFIASFLFGPRLRRLSFLFCHRIICMYIHICLDLAPPVTILLFHLISSHHFSGHCLWRLSFLLFGHRQWRPLSFYITASFLWAPTVATQFSCLSYSELYVRAPSGATLLCHLSSLPHLTGLRLWRLSFLFCHILHTHAYIHTYIHTHYVHTHICEARAPPVAIQFSDVSQYIHTCLH